MHNFSRLRILLLSLISMILSITACSEDFQNRNPIGQAFPSVQGGSLDGKIWKLPKDLLGQPSLLLLGYEQESQFDIDRWLIALVQIKLYEVPTIKAWIPRMISGRINEGMRSGIPKELWGAVITVYKDGERLQKLTGNINPRNARIILLDGQGQIRFFTDEGFSVPGLNKLINTLNQIKRPSEKQ